VPDSWHACFSLVLLCQSLRGRLFLVAECIWLSIVIPCRSPSMMRAAVQRLICQTDVSSRVPGNLLKVVHRGRGRRGDLSLELLRS